jgi:hypothetical protein
MIVRELIGACSYRMMTTTGEFLDAEGTKLTIHAMTTYLTGLMHRPVVPEAIVLHNGSC